MTRLIVPILALGIVAGRADAQPADPKATAASTYAEGEKLYQAGNYIGAADKFRAAYEADPDPVYLFNVAQAYRFGEDCVKSAEYYKKFFDKVPNPPNAAKIKGWQDEQETCAKARAAKVVKPDPALPPQPIPVRGDDKRQPEPREGQSNLTSYALIGGGVVLAGVGYLFQHAVKTLETTRPIAVNNFITENMCMVHACDVGAYNAVLDHYDSRALHDQIAMAASYGLGAAAIVYGIVRIATGHAEESPSPVTVTTSKTGAMVVGSWSF
jgi:tetratricopeptide (TPR) repeat protein